MAKEDEHYLYRHSAQLTKFESHVVTVEPPKESFLNLLRFGVGQLAERVVDAQIEVYQKAISRLEEDLGEKGLLGEHELLASPKVGRGVWGELNGEWKLEGHLFLVVGSLRGEGKLEGNTRTVASVQFAWRPSEDSTVVSEIPADKLLFCSDQSAKTPRISFVFNKERLIDMVDAYSARVFTFGNPNDYLRGDRLSVATVRCDLPASVFATLLPTGDRNGEMITG